MEYTKNAVKGRTSILQSVLLILLGLALIIWSDFILGFVVEVIGSMIIILGLVSIITHYQIKRKYPDIKKLAPFESYAAIVFGIVLILFPGFFISILMIILGIIVILGSFTQIYSLTQLKRLGARVHGALYISPIAMFIIGLYIVTNPYHSARALLIVLFGVFTLFYGVTSLIRNGIENQTINDDITAPQ
ncbi:MAG: DUF308 domain-containing protein [Rikenellaceae bacterium]